MHCRNQHMLHLLTHIGFNKIELEFDSVDYPNGPSFRLYCEK